MPRRDNGASDKVQNKSQTNQTAQDDDDKVWAEIENMKAKGGGDGGFDRMNTNFFLRDGEKADIVLIDDSPLLFYAHTIKCVSKKGKTFYATEPCQKREGDSCILCDSKNQAVGKAKQVIAFRLWDGRGSSIKNDDGEYELDGVPTPKIILTPIYLAKQIKALRDEYDGTLTDKVIQMEKNGNYQAVIKTKKLGGGKMEIVYAPDELEGDLPDILEVYSVREDDDILDFVRQYADSSDSKSGGNSGGGKSNNTGRRNGGFGV